MDNKIKSLGQAQLGTEADAKGHVRAVVCTYGVIDKDGDVVRKGAIPEGTPVILSQYNHNSITGSAMPVGSGVIKSVGDEAILEAEFFMDTTHGKDAFNTVRALSAKGLGEWSWGFIATDEERGQFEGKNVNFINMTKTFEASFVAVGAGVNTRTLEAKDGLKGEPGPELTTLTGGDHVPAPEESWKYDTALDKWVSSKGREATSLDALVAEEKAQEEGKKFSEEGSDVLKSLQSFRSRAVEVLAMRQEKGKTLGEAARNLITELVTEAKALEAMLADAPASTEDDRSPALDADGNDATIDAEDQALLDAFAAIADDINEGE